MKKTIIPVVLILLLLTSCLPDTPEPPSGVWMSEEPRIVLYFKPEYSINVGPPTYFGIYTIDGVERKVFVRFGAGLQFSIFDLTEPRGSDIASGVSHSGILLGGSYRVIGEEIRYRLFQESVEILGLNEIIFRRIEEYDPIDPEWVANFVPRPE